MGLTQLLQELNEKNANNTETTISAAILNGFNIYKRHYHWDRTNVFEFESATSQLSTKQQCNVEPERPELQH